MSLQWQASKLFPSRETAHISCACSTSQNQRLHTLTRLSNYLRCSWTPHTSTMLDTKKLITVCKRSCRKVMFSQACVRNSVHRGGCTPHPLGRHPSWADTPWADTPWADPPGQTPPRQTPTAVLLQCILVSRHLLVISSLKYIGSILYMKFY